MNLFSAIGSIKGTCVDSGTESIITSITKEGS